MEIVNQRKNFINPDYSVVTCFLNYKGKLLLLKRAKKDSQLGLWGIPGGKKEEAEDPEKGLVRELQEELGWNVNEEELQFLDKIPMKNLCDGSYLLYLYYYEVTDVLQITLNHEEHSEYQWASVEDFKKYQLLFCQGEAFDKVKCKLTQKVSLEACYVK